MAASSKDIPNREESNSSPVPEEGEAALRQRKEKLKIVLFEKIHHGVAVWFEERGFVVEEVPRGMVGEELVEKVKDATMIGIRSKTKVTEEVLRSLPNLRAIGNFCIGTNQVALDVAAELGVAVFNSPFENTRSVAELMIAEIISLSRYLGDRNNECHKGTWGKTSKNCHEIRGKRLGIVGYGHIGSQLSVMAEAMGMDVYFFDVVRKMPLGNSTRLDSLDQLLTTVDFASLHVPATPETHKMIGPKQLALMRPGSYLLNASRGSVVDLDALAASLREGHLRGAALDVYPVEPRSNTTEWTNVMQGLPNVILTPHIGGSTEEAQVNIGRDVRTKLYKYITTGKTLGSVNLPEIAIPFKAGTHRVCNLHKNIPGIMRAINNALGDFNITAQTLGTSGAVGYLVLDVESSSAEAIRQVIRDIPGTILTRVLW